MMEFRLLMLSAMYENGGNTTHRFLDGHPQMYVYPFESQLGTMLVRDHLTSMFPVKYRWPEFGLDSTAHQDYKAIIDEECKVRARTPRVSKFRHMPFDFDDDERCEIFVKKVESRRRSRGNNVAAFFQATFEAWKDYKRSGQEEIYVGYSPIVAVDARKIIEDLPHAHVLHVVRNPWSAYADTKKRPVPMSLERYITAWVTNQHHALVFKKLSPQRVHIVRYEDVISDPARTLGAICEKIGVRPGALLEEPTWNGEPLEEVYPWGTIRKATAEANKATAEELSSEEIDLVRVWTESRLDVFDYGSFM
ncbi:MAG: sulfotransferase [Desulfomonilaceae bacterium]|nr:sulfotransferase [Desulfomonilaceae bacterium]